MCDEHFFLPSVLAGGLKCPVCSFVYGTKWEFNRHLKNKHGLKVVEIDGDPKWEPATETSEDPPTQYLHIAEAEEDVQGTQAAVAALQDLRYTSENGDRLDPTAVNILQQIIGLGGETHDATAVASVVAMAPGTVTVVKQVRTLCYKISISPAATHLLLSLPHWFSGL
uniref:Zinc finger protein ZFAT-like n=1 Tax=Castor canadensis TaxID=51338 RepID=A0A8B7VI50_CASCN|nr:zinc finger protein ZFAT-like [Castor canadensis]